MFLGIVLHGMILEPSIPFLTENWNRKILGLISEVIHTFRMPLFFLLSGFFSAMLLRKYGFKKFLVNRLNRILIPLVISFLSVGILTILLYRVVNTMIKSTTAEFSLGVIFNDVSTADLRPIHLWFLYYLIFFIPLAVTCYFIGIYIKSTRLFKISGLSTGQNLLIWTLIASVSSSILVFSDKYIGEQPHISFSVNPGYFLHYFVFFGFGWLTYILKWDFEKSRTHAVKLLLFALILTPIRLFTFSFSSMPCYALTILIYNVSLWCYIFGLIGISQLYFNKPSSSLQYISESSYWIYLIHMPVLLALKIVFFGNKSFFLFFLIFITASYLCIVSYHYLVRSTFIGQLLNGKKFSRDFPLLGGVWISPKRIFNK